MGQAIKQSTVEILNSINESLVIASQTTNLIGSGLNSISYKIRSTESKEITLVPDIDVLKGFRYISIKTTGSAAAKAGSNAVLKIREYATALGDNPGVVQTTFSGQANILGTKPADISAELNLNSDLKLDGAHLMLLLAKHFGGLGGNYLDRVAFPLVIEVDNTSIYEPVPAAHISVVPSTVSTLDVNTAAAAVLSDTSVTNTLTAIGINPDDVTLVVGVTTINEDTGNIGIQSTITGADLSALNAEEQTTLNETLVAYYATELGVPESSIGILLTQGSIIIDVVIADVAPVESPVIDVESVTATSDANDDIINFGETAQITAVVLPVNASNKQVTYSSSDPLVATVDTDGVITPVSSGTFDITVTTVDGGFTTIVDSLWTNYSPVVAPTVDIDTLIGNTVTLEVSATDADLDSLDYTWTQTSGPSVVLAGPTDAPTFVAPDTTEPIVFTVSITDTFLTVSSIVTVNVTDAVIDVNDAPTVSVTGGPSIAATETDPVSLVAVGADLDLGDTLSYTWVQDSGTTMAVSGESTDTLTFTAPTPFGGAPSEELVFTVTVTDGELTGSDTVTVNVSLLALANNDPVITAGAADTVFHAANVSITSTATDADVGDTLSYLWTQISGSTVVLSGETTDTVSFVASSINEELVFNIAVTDGTVTVNAATTITVSDVNTAPVIDSLQDLVGVEGTSLTLVNTITDAESAEQDLTFAWVQLSGTNVTFTATDKAPSFVVPAFGTTGNPMTFQITVTDPQGLTDVATSTVWIESSAGQQLPIADVSDSWNTLEEDGTYTLLGSATDFFSAGGEPIYGDIGYEWTYVNGYADAVDVDIQTTDSVGEADFTAPVITNDYAANNAGPYYLNFQLKAFLVSEPSLFTVAPLQVLITNQSEFPTAVIGEGSSIAVSTNASSTLTASPNTGNVIYLWEQISTTGGNVTFDSPNGLGTIDYTSPSVNSSVVIRLTVTDSDAGTVSTDDITVIATVPVIAPVAVITGPAKMVYNDVQSFTAAASTDADGTIVGWSWTQDGNLSIANPASQVTNITAAGVTDMAKLTLTVTDNGANTHSTDMYIFSRPNMDNMPPIVMANVYYNPFVELTMDATGTFDVEGSPIIYSWEFIAVAGSVDMALLNQSILDADAMVATTAYMLENGEYTIRLIANDGTEDFVVDYPYTHTGF